MTYTDSFVTRNNLQPADAIVLKKKFLGMFDHFAVYLGRHPETQKHLFAANYNDGVQLVKQHELDYFLQTLQPDRIEKFNGTPVQRKGAIRRALSKIGEKGYNLIWNNCQHYASFVQYGKKYSPQVDNIGKTLAVGGATAALIGLASKNSKAAGWGALIFALGALAVVAANRDDS